jgi:hypothetical protein
MSILTLDQKSLELCAKMSEVALEVNSDKLYRDLSQLRSNIHDIWEQINELTDGTVEWVITSKTIISCLAQQGVPEEFLVPLRKMSSISTSTLRSLTSLSPSLIPLLLRERQYTKSESALSSLYELTLNKRVFLNYVLSKNKSKSIYSVKPNLSIMDYKNYLVPTKGKIFVEVGMNDAIVYILANTFRDSSLKDSLGHENALTEMTAKLHGISVAEVKPEQRSIVKSYLFARTFTSRKLNKDELQIKLFNSMVSTGQDFPTNLEAQSLLQAFITFSPWAKKEYTTPFGRSLPSSTLEVYINTTLSDFEKSFLSVLSAQEPNLLPVLIVDNIFLFEIDYGTSLIDFNDKLSRLYNEVVPENWLPLNIYTDLWF